MVSFIKRSQLDLDGVIQKKVTIRSRYGVIHKKVTIRCRYGVIHKRSQLDLDMVSFI